VIGFGALGLLSNLCPYAELAHESAFDKRTLVELRPRRAITSWSRHSGAAHVAPFLYEFCGTRLDVVALRTGVDVSLRRAETLGECVSAAGTYFYDPDEAADSARWDDGVSTWDGGGRWDRSPKLYLHLTSGANPAEAGAVAELGCYFSGVGDVHPDLGPDKLVGGDFESWPTPVEAEGWTSETSGPGWGVFQDFVFAVSGRGAASAGSAGLGAGHAGLRQDVSCVAGRCYRLSGWYLSAGAVQAVLLAGRPDESAFVHADGRSLSGSGRAALAPTHEQWRRFCFDFVAPHPTTRLRLRAVPDGIGAGEVRFDGVRLQRVWRWNYHAPRLSASAVPETTTGSNDVFFGGKQIGAGSLTLTNSDGRLDRLFGDLDWTGARVVVRFGGRFLDGQALTLEEYRHSFTGVIQAYRGRDSAVVIDLQDERAVFHVKVPEASYSEREQAELDPRFAGKPRPLWFGRKENVTPVGIARDAATGYRVYELCDCGRAPAGMHAVSRVWAYATEGDAADLRPDRRRLLVPGSDYTVDLLRGRLSVVRDVHLLEITTSSNRLDFSDGALRSAALAPGLYTPALLALEAQRALRSVGTPDLACSYDEVAHRFTVSRTTGVLSLLISTGTNKALAAWKTLGYDPGADRTGARSYTAEEVVFTDADKQHVLRVDGAGYADDAAGTWTGRPGALIETGADICRALLVRWLRKDPAILDEVSLRFAREKAPQALALYLKAPTTTKDVLEALEVSTAADIVIDGAGRVYYQLAVAAVGGVVDLFDRDFVEWEVERSAADVYAAVQVLYDEDPTTGRFRMRSASDEAVRLRFGRQEFREFRTYLTSGDDAQAAADRLGELARQPARRVTAVVKGKLVDHRVGQKVRVTRRRSLDPLGRLTGQVFRILSLKQSHQQARTQVVMADDVAWAAAFVEE